MRFTRTQFLDLMTFGDCPRQMFSELFGLLVGVDREWSSQGASRQEIELTAFDWDYVPFVECGGNTGPLVTGPPETIHEDDETLTQRDHLGRTIKLIKSVATNPLPLDYPVREMEDWLRLKPLYEFRESWIDWNAVRAAGEAQRQGVLVVGRIPGGFDVARELMGEEVACLAYYTQPELMQDILDTVRETAVKVFERLTERLTVDQLFVHEDLAGKSGPLIGPAQVQQFIRPLLSRGLGPAGRSWYEDLQYGQRWRSQSRDRCVSGLRCQRHAPDGAGGRYGHRGNPQKVRRPVRHARRNRQARAALDQSRHPARVRIQVAATDATR